MLLHGASVSGFPVASLGKQTASTPALTEAKEAEDSVLEADTDVDGDVVEGEVVERTSAAARQKLAAPSRAGRMRSPVGSIRR